MMLVDDGKPGRAESQSPSTLAAFYSVSIPLLVNGCELLIADLGVMEMETQHRVSPFSGPTLIRVHCWDSWWERLLGSRPLAPVRAPQVFSPLFLPLLLLFSPSSRSLFLTLSPVFHFAFPLSTVPFISDRFAPLLVSCRWQRFGRSGKQQKFKTSYGGCVAFCKNKKIAILFF